MSIVNIVCSNIIVKNKKILLVKESKDIDKYRYSLPGGRLEFGETLMEGAQREANQFGSKSIEVGGYLSKTIFFRGFQYNSVLLLV
jgi:hypothetical protein